MKNIIYSILSVLVVFGTQSHGQNLKIGVVDIEQALKAYYRTSQEVEKINQLGTDKIRNIDERKAAYEQMTSEMSVLDRSVRAPELSEEKREAAFAKLEELARNRNAKAEEIGDAERKANQELYELRQAMEVTLLAEIKVVVDQVAAAQGYDMIFDKSFLPKASKSILYTSNRVVDFTNEVIARLNAGAKQ